MFLTKEDLITLTGTSRKKQQIYFLTKWNIFYMQNLKGEIIVSRNHIEQVLGVSIKVDSEGHIEPDFSFLM